MFVLYCYVKICHSIYVDEKIKQTLLKTGVYRSCSSNEAFAQEVLGNVIRTRKHLRTVLRKHE